LDIDLR